jgi:hypothetical protein
MFSMFIFEKGLRSMKRSGIVAGWLLSAFLVAGCGGGIEEGSPKSGPMEPQPADFKEYMKKNAANMQPKASQKQKYQAPAESPETKKAP